METQKRTEWDNPEALSNARLVLRMLALAWNYRTGCIKVLGLNLLLLGLGIAVLGFMGTGIDYLRFVMHERSVTALSTADQVPATLHSAPTATTKSPRWPWGVRPPQHWPPLKTITCLAAAIVLFAVARAVITMLNVVVTTRLVQGKIVVDLRARVYEKMQQLSFRFFDANASGSLINRVTGDVQSVRSFIDGVVIQTVTLILSLLIYLIYMARIHLWLTIACLASTPLLWVLTGYFSKKVRPEYQESRKLYDKVILFLSESINGVQVVKGFSRHMQQQQQFDTYNASYRDRQFWIFKMISFYQPLIGFMTQINLIVMLGYGGYLVVQHEKFATATVVVGISIGQLLVFAGLLQQFSNQVANITQIANSVQQSLIGAQRVFEILDTRIEIISPRHPVALGRLRGDICFDKVSFSYDKDEVTLADVDFRIESGTCMAIVGQTGSGKSTLLSLIPRFYDPQSGRILVDGVDIAAIDLGMLRRSIGIVFQESFLFSNSIAANIAFGHPYATREQIERAARTACAHDFIMELPKGYDTILHESGSNLSGGQRQRLAIARAILLEPPILLLDDPTAAVDPETEEEIMDAIAAAMQGRTTIVVAHRLSTLRRADSVLVMNRGRIVEFGTHDELMHVGGHYHRAAALQTPDAESLQLLSDGLGALT